MVLLFPAVVVTFGALVLAVVFAVIGVLVRFSLERYRDSRLYEGLGDDAGDGR